MRAADIADDIVVATTNWRRDGELTHPRDDNFVDFDHGTTLISSRNAKYSAEVVVGITESGEAVLYDVVDIAPTTFDIKKEETSTTATTQNAVGDIQEISSARIVPRNAKDVNTEFSLSVDGQGNKEEIEYFEYQSDFDDKMTRTNTASDGVKYSLVGRTADGIGIYKTNYLLNRDNQGNSYIIDSNKQFKYNNTEEVGEYNGEAAKLLERREILAIDRGKDDFGKSSTNSAMHTDNVGISQGSNAALRETIRPRESNKITERTKATHKKAGQNFDESIFGRIPRVVKKKYRRDKNTRFNKVDSFDESAFSFMPNEPKLDNIAISQETQFLNGLNGEHWTYAQMHIVDMAKRLDPSISVEFADDIVENGKYIVSQNKIIINSKLGIRQMYIEVFKHEFMHMLEKRKLYNEFSSFCFSNSKAFEQYLRLKCALINSELDFKNMRFDDVADFCIDYKYNQYKSSYALNEHKDNFTIENAKEEIIADFFAEILFQGERYRESIIKALENTNVRNLLYIKDVMSSESALMELCEKEPNLFKKIVEWIKDIFDSIRTWIQGDTLADDLGFEIDYLEEMVKRVYKSKDSQDLNENGHKEAALAEKYSLSTISNELQQNTKKCAEYFMNKYDSNADSDIIAEKLDELLLVQDENGEETLQDVYDNSGKYVGELTQKERLINEIAVRIADEIAAEKEEYANDVISYIVDNNIYVNTKQRLKIRHMFGSLTNYYKDVGVMLYAQKNSRYPDEWVALDDVWENFLYAYPELFDSIISSEEMPARLAEIIEYLNSLTEDVDYENIMADIVEDLYDVFGGWDQYMENIDANEEYRACFTDMFREYAKYDDVESGSLNIDRFESINEFKKQQYDKFGWTLYNEILTNEQLKSLLARYDEHQSGKANFPATRFDEVVVYSEECPEILMYIKDSAATPTITRIVKINDDNIEQIRNDILFAELEQDIFGLVSAKERDGNDIEIYIADDALSYWEYQRQFMKKKNAKKDALIKKAQAAARGELKSTSTKKKKIEPVIDEEKEHKLAYCFVKCRNEEKIAKAEKMESVGKDNIAIWRELKIFRGIFGDWVRMLGTNLFAFYVDKNIGVVANETNGKNTEGKLSEFVVWKELFELFPQFRDIEVRIIDSQYEKDTAKYLPHRNRLIVNKRFVDNFSQNGDKILKVHLIREIQRMIQFEEGKYIGKSYDYWKNLEENGKLPFFDKLNRTLTADDMMKYFIDNYEAELAARMCFLSSVISRVYDNKVRPTKEMLLYAPYIQPDVALMFDDKENIITVRENDISTGENKFSNFAQSDLYWDLLREYDIDEESIEVKLKEYYSKYYDEDLFGEAFNLNLRSDNVEEYGETSTVVKDFVASSQKNRKEQQMLRRREDIKGGNSGFLKNEELLSYDNSSNNHKTNYIDADVTSNKFLKRLYSRSAIPIADSDTIGRKLDEDTKDSLAYSIMKNNTGEPLSLYYVNKYGQKLLNYAQLGIAVGTVDMAIEKYMAENDIETIKKSDVCEEYYAIIKKPLILPFEPYELTVSEMGFWMTQEHFMSRDEYFYTVDKLSQAKSPSFKNIAFKKIRKRLKEFGYDSIIYVNKNYDIGSLAVVVFDDEQLIPVAKNGVTLKNLDIINEEKKIKTPEVTGVKINSSLMREFVDDGNYIQRKYRKKPDERIAAGSSDWFESSEIDSKNEYNKIIKMIKGKSELEYNKYSDPLDRDFNKTLEKRFNKTVFKTEDGNFISFYIWSKKEISIENIVRKGFEFKCFSGAFNDFVAEKKRAKFSYNGIFYEYIINSVNPLVVELDGWDTANVVNLLYEKEMISKTFYDEIVNHPHFNNPKYTNYAAKKLRNKIELLGFDSIIFVKENGENSLLVLDENQILTIAQNGILEEDNGISQEINVHINTLIENETMAESVVIDRTDRTSRNVEKMEKAMVNMSNNTNKMLWLTEYLACTNNPDAEEEIIVGHTSVFDSKTKNIWSAKSLLQKLIYNSKQNQISSYDSAGRKISKEIKQSYKDTIFKDSDGRLLSLFIWNKYGDSRYRHSAFPYNIGSLKYARNIYISQRQKQPNMIKGDYEEYYANIKNPYFMVSVPEKISARTIVADMYANGVLSKSEYRIITAREGVDWIHRDNNSAKKLREVILEKSIDAIVYINKQNDDGNLCVIVLEEENLHLVSKNGIATKETERNKIN